MKLRTKFMTSFTIFALLPALVLGVAIFIISRQSSIADTQNLSLQTVEAIGMATDKAFATIKQINMQTSKYPDAMSVVNGDTELIPQLTNQLKDLVDIYSEMDNLLVVNKKGIVIVSTMDNLVGYDFSKNPAFIESSKTGQEATAKPSISVVHGLPIAVISTPIYDNKEVKGYIMCAVNLNVIYTEMVKERKLLDTGYVCVVDQDKRMIMHPDEKVLLSEEEIALPVEEIVTDATQGTGSYNFNDEKHYYAYAKSSNIWAYIAVMDKNEVEALSKQILTTLLIVLISCGIIYYSIFSKTYYESSQRNEIAF